MFKLPLLTGLLVLAAAPAFAAGDAAKGESLFKKCKACHSIIAPDGTEIQKGGKSAPNLYGVIGATAGAGDFEYGPSLKAIGAAGTVWTEELIVEFLKDPAKWVKDTSGEATARTKMTLKLAKGGEDVAAYLASVSGDTAAAAPAAEAADAPAADAAPAEDAAPAAQ